MSFIVPFPGTGRDFSLAFRSFSVGSLVNMAIGPADPGRYIISASTAFSFNSPLTSLTIGGVAATKLISVVGTASVSEIWMAFVPNGTTATVVPTFANVNGGFGISLYSLIGPLSIGAFATSSSLNGSNPTLNINVPAKGCCIGVTGGRQNAQPSIAWTAGLTQDANAAPGANLQYSSASKSFVPAQSPLLVSAQFSGGSTTPNQSMVAASFGNP